MIKADPPLKNSQMEDMEDVPKDEIERKDGLPAADEPVNKGEIFKEPTANSGKKVMINISICGDAGDSDKITEFLAKIMGSDKSAESDENQ